MEPTRFYKPELDVLRFLAFLGVFISHVLPHDVALYIRHGISPRLASAIPMLGDTGAYGVDLFFLLSAYLITKLLLREKDMSGDVHLGYFYIRRMLRIWPLYFLAIGLAWILTRFDPAEHFPANYIAGFLLFSGNWVCALHGFPQSVAAPLWSVSVEEQFYVLWPPMVKWAGRRTTAGISVGMIAISSLARGWFFNLGWRDGLWTNSLTRLEPIALGILIALLPSHLRLVKTEIRAALALSGMAMLVYAARLENLSTSLASVMFRYPLVSVGAAVIFIGALGTACKLLVNPWMIHMGRISYGLYVYHQFGISAASKVVGVIHSARIFALFCLLSFLSTAVMAVVSYRFLEQPFLHLKERFEVIPSSPI